jgi:SAM-dependent methyltransferase
MKLLLKLYYFLGLKAGLCCADTFTILFKKKNEAVPPKSMSNTGAGDFVKQGRHLADLVINYAELKPDGKILDIGCGIGRLAAPLAKYLTPEGHYDGLDIVRKDIEWCEANIAGKYPNFHFHHVNLKNDIYNKNAILRADTYVFPYPDDFYDCVVLTAVFTHMMPGDVNNYLKQIARVMKKDGLCLISLFLLTPESKEEIIHKRTNFYFVHTSDGYCLMSDKEQEPAVAYENNLFQFFLSRHGLYARNIRRGAWANGTLPLDFHDVMLITRTH